MAYVPDPTNVNQPTDAVIAETAQAEFRALKAYVAGLAGLGSGMNLFRKNRIINGAINIDQRNNGATVNTNGAIGADRFKLLFTGVTGTIQQRGDTPPVGFTDYLRIATTSNAAPGAGEFLGCQYTIEGSDCYDLSFGNAAAKLVTVSGFFRSTKIGTYGIGLRNAASNRSYVGAVIIAVANTWEYHQVNLTGDIAGVWATDITAGVTLNIFPVVGATFTTVAGAWIAGNFLGAVGQTQNSANTDTFDFTGFQFEQAGAASPFEFRLAEQELALCMRYGEPVNFDALGGSAAGGGLVGSRTYFKVKKRTTPSISTTIAFTGGNVTLPPTIDTIDSLGCRIYTTVSGAGNANLDGSIFANAEI